MKLLAIALVGVASQAWMSPDSAEALQVTPEVWAVADMAGWEEGLPARHDDPLRLMLTLPEGTSQDPGGPSLATVFHLRVGGLSRLSSPAYVQGNWEGKGFLQLALKPSEGLGGRQWVQWSTNDLVNGPTRGYETEDVLDLVLANFPQFGSAKGGSNELVISIVADNPVSLDALVLPDSFVRRSSEGPPLVAVKAVRLGHRNQERATLNVSLARSGEPARWVNVSAQILDSDGHLIGSGYETLESLDDELTLELIGTELNRASSIVLSVSSPGGDSLPTVLTVESDRNAWELIEDRLPWAWVFLIAFPLAWVGFSSTLATARRASAVGLLALATLLFSTTPDEAAAAQIHLPWLPRVSEAERLWLSDKLESEEDKPLVAHPLPRGSIAVLTAYGIPVGFVLPAAACDTKATELSISRPSEGAHVVVYGRC